MFHHGMFGGGMGSGLIFLVMIFGVVFYIAFKKQDSKEEPVSHTGESAIDILNKRYTDGEISLGEYRRIKNEITH